MRWEVEPDEEFGIFEIREYDYAGNFERIVTHFFDRTTAENVAALHNADVTEDAQRLETDD